MTLIIAAGNNNFAVLAADRRLTCDGRIVEDEANKSTIFACPNARIAISFTGLAKYGSHSTENWLLEILRKILQSSLEIDDVIEKFKSEASLYFGKLNLHDSNRLLTFIFLGYTYGEQIELRCWTVSNNHKNNREFKLEEHIPDRSSGILLRIEGSQRHVYKSDLLKIREMLETNKPSHALQAKAYHTIKKTAAIDPVVGQQANCTVIYKNTNQKMLSTYYSAHASRKVYGANSIFGFSTDGAMVTLGSELIVGESLPPTTVPKVEKNALCPCESGLKYRECHRNISYPYLPLHSSNSIGENEFPSGKNFIVECKGAAAKL